MKVPALALALGLSANANAEPANDFDFYVRAHAGATGIHHHGNVLDDDSGAANGISLGWHFLPWLAVEGGVNRFGEFSEGRSVGFSRGSGSSLHDLDNVELGLRGRVSIDSTGAFLQARVGVHHWDFEGFRSGTEPYFGVGLGNRLGGRWNFSVSYDRYQVGSSYHFVDRLYADRICLGVEWTF